MRALFVVLLFLLAGCAGSSPSGASGPPTSLEEALFVIREGRVTIATERSRRALDYVEAEMEVVDGPVSTIKAHLHPDALIRRVEIQRGEWEEESALSETIVFRGAAVMHTRDDGAEPIERITPAGIFPFGILSPTLIEQAARRALFANQRRVRIPFWVFEGDARVALGTVRVSRSNEMVLRVENRAILINVDPWGRLLSARLPAEGITIYRAAPDPSAEPYRPLGLQPHPEERRQPRPAPDS